MSTSLETPAAFHRRESTAAWPNLQTRRALIYVAGFCAAVIIWLGFAVNHTMASWAVSPEVRHYFWGIPVDALPLSAERQHAARFLVVFGEPWVYALALAILFSFAAINRDRTLAFISLASPLTAQFLTELVAKPWVHRMAGPYYSYPSGHVTATVSIMAVCALAIRRVNGRRSAFIAVPFLISVVVGSMVGVIVLHMHDLIDAIGGLAMGIGVTSLWSAIALEPQSLWRPLSSLWRPLSSLRRPPVSRPR